LRRIALILKKDFKRRLKSPWGVVILLVIPVVMTAIFGAVFSPAEGENVLPRIKLLLSDNDKNFAAKFLIQAFDVPQMKEMFAVSIVDEKQGRKLMQKGKASALIIIPPGFTASILDAEETAITLVKNPAERFLPGIVEEFMITFSVVVSGFVQVFADEIGEIKNLLETPVERVAIPALTPFLEQSKAKIVTLKSVLSPLLIGLKKEIQQTKKKEQPKPTLNIFSLILPALSIMFILFIVEIFLREILTEKEEGTLRRMWFSPLTPREYILAKMISGWLMGLLVLLIIVVIGKILFSIGWGSYLFLFIFGSAALLCIAGFFALLNAFCKNKNQAAAVSSPLILIFAAFGGSMIPLDQLPHTFRIFSHFTINFWFIRGVEQILTGKFPLLQCLVLTAAGLLFFAVSLIILPRRITV
jgi:ABC-2 type transport system permease protein